MKGFPRVWAALVVSCVFAATAAGQDAAGAAGSGTATTAIARLNDWFLSTGRWADDPQIYVAEFARRAYPVGIIVGDHDFVDMGTPLLSAWARAVPRLELAVLPDAGYLPWIDQPEAFRTLLQRHLDRGGPPTPSARRDP